MPQKKSFILKKVYFTVKALIKNVIYTHSLIIYVLKLLIMKEAKKTFFVK